MSEKSLLLIEPNQANADLARFALNSGEVSCHLTVVESIQDAFIYLNTDACLKPNGQRPMLALILLALSQTENLEFLRRLRSDSSFRYIPVVVLATETGYADKLLNIRHGANACLQKPDNPEAYQTLVRDTSLFWLKHNELPYRSSGKAS